MDYMYAQLVDEHIRRLHDDAAIERLVRQARRAGRPSRVGRIWHRISQPARRPTPVRTRPAHTLDATTSST
jgi:hypothetical protein